jgi:membrane-associated progesterone receptor component
MSETEKVVTFWDELTSPINLALVGIIIYLIYKILQSKFESSVEVAPPPPPLPKIRKDLTVTELKKYDGTQPDGRVLLAVNGVIFDVTKGKRFYGPGE